MNNDEILNGLISKLDNDFQISGKNLPAGNDFENSLNEIKKYLIEKIIAQMEKNFERFLNTLYRIDLDENKLNDILANQAVSEIPGLIADMIIERQVQRVRTQLLYKQGKL